MRVFEVEAIKRELRNYQNEVAEIWEDLDNDLMTRDQSEKALIQLDTKYAKIISELKS